MLRWLRWPHLTYAALLWLLARVLALLHGPLPDLGEVEALCRRGLCLTAAKYLRVVRGRLELLILLHGRIRLSVCVRCRHTGKKVESAHMPALEVVACCAHYATGNRADCRTNTRDYRAESRPRRRPAKRRCGRTANRTRLIGRVCAGRGRSSEVAGCRVERVPVVVELLLVVAVVLLIPVVVLLVDISLRVVLIYLTKRAKLAVILSL